jgi:hypothetical protein
MPQCEPWSHSRILCYNNICICPPREVPPFDAQTHSALNPASEHLLHTHIHIHSIQFNSPPSTTSPPNQTLSDLISSRRPKSALLLQNLSLLIPHLLVLNRALGRLVPVRQRRQRGVDLAELVLARLGILGFVVLLGFVLQAVGDGALVLCWR